MTVGEVCNREVVVATPGASVLDAARLMKTHHVGDLAKLVAREQKRERQGRVAR